MASKPWTSICRRRRSGSTCARRLRRGELGAELLPPRSEGFQQALVKARAAGLGGLEAGDGACPRQADRLLRVRGRRSHAGGGEPAGLAREGGQPAEGL